MKSPALLLPRWTAAATLFSVLLLVASLSLTSASPLWNQPPQGEQNNATDFAGTNITATDQDLYTPDTNVTLTYWPPGNGTASNGSAWLPSSMWASLANNASASSAVLDSSSSVGENGRSWRNVSIIADIDYRLPRYEPSGLRLLGGHMALWLAGTPSDGPLQIEYIRSANLAVRVYDWNVANANWTIMPDGPLGNSRRVFQLGRSQVTNAAMADPGTGNGIVADLYQAQPGYQSGVRSGLHFVRALSTQLGLKQGPSFDQLFRLLERYEQQPPLLSQGSLSLLLENVTVWGDGSKNTRVLLDLGTNQTLLPPPTPPLVGNGSYYPDASEPQPFLSQLRQPLLDPWDNRGGSDQSTLQQHAAVDLAQAGALRPRGVPTSRSFYIILDVMQRFNSISPSFNKPEIKVHSSLQIDGVVGDNDNVPMRIEKLQVDGQTIKTRVLVYGPGQGTIGRGDKVLRRIYDGGKTSRTNAEILDSATGKGLLSDIMAKAPTPRYRAGSYDCNSFARDLAVELGWKPHANFESLVARSNEVFLREQSCTEIPEVMVDRVAQPGNKYGGYWRTTFDVTQAQAPKVLSQDIRLNSWGDEIWVAPPRPAGAVSPSLGPPPPSPFQVEFGSDPEHPASPFAAAVEDARPLFPPHPEPPLPISPFIDPPSQPVDPSPGRPLANDGSSGGSSRAGLTPGESLSSKANSAVSLCQRGLDRRSCAPAPPGEEMGILRVSNALRTFKLVAFEVGHSVSQAMGPLFIIIDLVQGRWVGAAIGVISTGVSLMAAMVFTGVMGFLFPLAIGALIGLFSILPSIIPTYSSVLPTSGSALEIIQYAMFGDAKHTGNELCQAGTADTSQNPNCQALYGPTVIRQAFKWDEFQAIAFMLDSNHGYAMSIPDMAAAFCITDSRTGGCGNSTAVITCNAPMVCPYRHCQLDTTQCKDAVFSLKLERISIPVINQMADVVSKRVMPNPGGDCKLVSDVSGAQYPDYNLTVTGSPVAVACNLTELAGNGQPTAYPQDDSSTNATGTVNGTVTDTNTANLSNGTYFPGNSSSDGSAHYVPAPAPEPFAVTMDFSNSIHLGGSGGKIRLPRGHYGAQSGSLGFSTQAVENLLMPAGASLSFTVLLMPDENGILPDSSLKTITTNQTSKNNLGRDMKAMSTQPSDNTFDVVVPGPAPVVACLFTQTQFLGDVACLGPGGGDLASELKQQTRSVRLYGGVSIWLYVDHYNDVNGVQVTSSVGDLTTLALGNGGNWDKKAVAAWIIDQQGLAHAAATNTTSPNYYYSGR